MTSTKSYRDFILDQLSGLDEITTRPMMGEFILYYRGTIIGGIYDDRLLLKPVSAAAAYLPAPRYERPYPGAKEMILVEDVDTPEQLMRLCIAVYDELSTRTAGRPKKT